ncbi:MAG: HNH endonuclease [Verrucomicrobia bacterium]|nr:MAG: HNH endonuclease [Verrucomicrobiota bacterium]
MTITEEVVKRVWEKGTIVAGADSSAWRQDECTAWIHWESYGRVDEELGYGWEVDHIRPVSEGGGDELSNLRPLHWKNNRGKQAGRLVRIVVSSGNRNVLAR